MLHVDDDAFVRAPVRLVYPHLTHLAAYPRWWPGVAMQPVGRGGAELFRLTMRAGRLSRPLRLIVHPNGWRHDAGFHMSIEGDLDGRAEWWLEEGWGGTVVHHLASFEAIGASPRRALTAYRRALRQGLWACKDVLQSEVRRSAGVAP
ncbi:MAG TPA: SRPBCC family protein [Nitriliruptorales bacterium]